MKSQEMKHPDFLANIDFDFVEKKCLLAYQEFKIIAERLICDDIRGTTLSKKMLTNPILELLKMIDNKEKLGAFGLYGQDGYEK
jgi:hypothetical protein